MAVLVTHLEKYQKGEAGVKPTTLKLEAYLVQEQARFYRLAYSYLHNKDEVLDAVQTAICRALEQRGKLRDKELLKSWFMRILVNTCLDMLRQRKRVSLIAPEDLTNSSYEDPLPEDETLAERINRLSLEEQTIIKLRFYEDLSLKEISLITDTNLSTVKTRLYSALKKLRISLEGAMIE